MSEVFPIADYNDVPEAVSDRAQFCKPFRGFFLATEASPLKYYAYYTDGVIEEINPIAGKPRPNPDPADRTKNQKVTLSDVSLFTGLARLMAQCMSGQGKVFPLRATFELTHGILEYPYPRTVGATVEEEKAFAAARKFWLIEISASGVYIAPISMGVTCCSMLDQLTRYRQTTNDPVSLAWAFTGNNPHNLIVRLKTAAEMASIFASVGSAWNLKSSWAFSYSGRRASNVVSRFKTYQQTPPPSGIFCYGYTKQLVDFEFGVTVVEGSPDEYTIDLTVGAEKSYNHEANHVMLYGGVYVGTYLRPMWVSDIYSDGRNTDGVFLETTKGAEFLASLPQDCPVFTFYEGERQITFHWSRVEYSGASGFYMTANPSGPPYDKSALVAQPHLSTLILFPENREAAGFLVGTKSGSTWAATYFYFNRSKFVQTDFTLSDSGMSEEDFGVVRAIIGGSPPIAAALFPYQMNNPFLPRNYWVDMDLCAYGGAIYYTSPELDPVDQKLNNVRRFNNVFTLDTGFASIGSRIPYGFVGKI